MEKARNMAHAGEIEKMCLCLDEAKYNDCDENIVKMIEIVEKCGNSIAYHHKMLDDVNEKFSGKEKDHTTMAVKYAKYGLLDMMNKQIEKASSLILNNKKAKEKLDFVEITGHKVSCYRDLITTIVNISKNNNKIANNFLQSTKEFSKKSCVDVKEEIKMIEKIMK